MRRPVLLALLLVPLCAAGGEALRTVELGPSQRRDASLTVYTHGHALVRERYRLAAGETPRELVFRHLPDELDAGSLSVHGDGLEVTAIGYDARLLTPRRLLEAHVGELVRIVRIDPVTGEEVSRAAEILSTADGVVVRIGDRVVSDPEGRIVFTRVPEGLHPRPVLRARVRATPLTTVELAYLTGGLSWRMEYIARLPSAGDRMRLTGWALVDNRSEHDFGPVRLALVAGDVHRAPVPGGMERMAVTAAPRAENLAGAYRIYRFDEPWRIPPRSLQRRPLLAEHEVRVERRYLVAGGRTPYTLRVTQAPRREHALLRVEWRNEAPGTPLPAGRVHVYEEGPDGVGAVLGVDRLPDTPRGGDVQLTLGRAFDVWALRRQTEYRVEQAPVPYRRQTTTAHEVVLHNGLEGPVSVQVEETIPGQWEILEQSHPHERLDTRRARWEIRLPAGATRTLRYWVRVLE